MGNGDGEKARSADEVYDALLRRVLDGDLSPGVRLPNEQSFADQYGVARSTLRKALDRLRDEKLIVSRRGDGHYIAGLSENEVCSIRFEMDSKFFEVFEVRKLLDVAAAAQAAVMQDPNSIRRLEDAQREICYQLKQDVVDLLSVRSADIEFHQQLSRNSPNSLMVQLTEALRAAVGPFWIKWRALEVEQQRQLVESTFNEHELILMAIKTGNPPVAEQAMRHHFQTSEDRYINVFGS